MLESEFANRFRSEAQRQKKHGAWLKAKYNVPKFNWQMHDQKTKAKPSSIIFRALRNRNRNFMAKRIRTLISYAESVTEDDCCALWAWSDDYCFVFMIFRKQRVL